jgi:hypothetical protein
MSWSKSENEGRTCWERQDGARLYSTQEIDALEAFERKQAEERNKSLMHNHIRYSDELDKEINQALYNEEMNPITYIILLCMFIGAIIYAFLNN